MNTQNILFLENNANHFMKTFVQISNIILVHHLGVFGKFMKPKKNNKEERKNNIYSIPNS